MGASFRNKDEIAELAGCDLLTISPHLLEELKKCSDPLVRKLDIDHAKHSPIQKMSLDEKAFRYLLNEDAMATEKLAEGIRNFAKDLIKLETYLKSKL
jgi:transaldolase